MEPVNQRLSARAIGAVKGAGTLGWATVGLLWTLWAGATSITGAAELGAPATPEATPVQFRELIDVLQSNLAGATPETLNRAAVAGLLEQLASRVVLLEDGATPKSTNLRRGPALSTTVFDRSYGYLRIATLTPDIGPAFQSAIEGLTESNKLRGLIVDLRFTTGGEYATAVAVADRFFGQAQDLVDWGEGMNRSTTKSNAAGFITLPTTVLINRQTAGPAEVLAGILRHGEAALLVGTNSAGQAGITREFPLKTGQRVRVAVAPVKVLSEHELPFTGLSPDIEVGVDADEERLFMEDAYRVIKSAMAANSAEIAVASTNNRPRRRVNEAELVRMAREGQDPRDLTTPPPLAGSSRPSEPALPVVTDPVLARALDILKGLAVVQRFRGP